MQTHDLRLEPTWHGKFADEGRMAAGSALAAGATRLTAAFVGQIASFGRAVESVWLTDQQIAGAITMPRGNRPHPRSVARVRRIAAQMGLISSRRVLPGQTPRGAEFESGHGTTEKIVNWAVLRNLSGRSLRRGRPIRSTPVKITTPNSRPTSARSPSAPQVRDMPRHSAYVSQPVAPSAGEGAGRAGLSFEERVRLLVRKPSTTPIDSRLAALIAEMTPRIMARGDDEDARAGPSPPAADPERD